MRDIELGELACAIVDLEVWRAFGYASFDHYCRERIGLAASSVATRVALTRRFGNVPEVRTALGPGRICYEAAALVARICGPMNVHAWIERATQRTVKLPTRSLALCFLGLSQPKCDTAPRSLP